MLTFVDYFLMINFATKIVFLKHISYIFVLLVLMNVEAVFAQVAPEVDSLSVAAGVDALVVKGDTFAIDPLAGDSLHVDSTAVVLKKEPMFTSRIKYKAADSIKFNIQDRRAYMYKETQINYEDIELKTFKAEVDMVSKILYAKGGRDSLNRYLEAPVFKQGNQVFDADSMSYNFDSKKAIVHRIITQQGEGFMQATKAKRYPDGHIDLGGGIYTTCDADHPHFGLRLSKAKVMPGDKTVFGPAYMELLDIPLYPLFLPFGFFPQNNKQAVSGLIPPSIGMELSRGLSLTNGGYYFAFNEQFDVQIIADIYSTGTWRSNMTSRYIKRYKFSDDLTLSYGVTVSGEKGLDQTKSKQYSIQWSHRQDAKAHPNHTFQGSVNYSSSSYDKQFNYNDISAVTTNTKASSVSFTQRWPNSPFSLSANMRANQNSDGGVTIDFPDFNFRMERIYPFRKKESVGKPKWYEDITLQYDATLKNTLTGHEDNLFSETNLKNMKNGFQHKIPFSINFKALKFFNITPSMNYTGVFYTSQIRKTFYADSTGADTRRGVLVIDTIRGLSYAHALAPSLSVSMNPKFYLTNTYGPNSKVQAIRTVISPTVGISYVPDLSRFFDYSKTYVDGNEIEKRYTIYDHQTVYRVPTMPGQSGAVSLGVNGNVEMKVRSDDSTSNVQSRKIKLINNISATTSYNIFKDTMKLSPINLSANTTIFGLNLNMSGNVSPYKLTPAGNEINQFGPRLTRMSFNTSISLPLNKKDAKKDEKKGETNDDYSYFDVPWNLSLSYGISYDKPRLDGKITQTLSFSGNVNFTSKWSLNFSSSYDFTAKKIASMTPSIQRDLHCWQMSFNFSPFGAYKFYFFKINVKSATLQDLKYEKRKSQSDYLRQSW